MKFILFLNLVFSFGLLAQTFQDEKDGVVVDKARNLVWQKCSGGQKPETGCSETPEAYPWKEAETYCSKLKLANRKWRIPTIEELKTIVLEKSSDPAIDEKLFPNTAKFFYWSSTVSPSNSSYVYILNFKYGRINEASKANSYHIRCVSDK